MHYFLAVVAPVLALGFLNRLFGFMYFFGTIGKTVEQFALVGGIAFVLGIGAFVSYPPTASVARKVWIFPLCLFVLAVCWDLHVLSDWRIVVPGAGNTDEPWDGYWLVSFPLAAAVSYALGNWISEKRLFRPTAIDVAR